MQPPEVFVITVGNGVYTGKIHKTYLTEPIRSEFTGAKSALGEYLLAG